MSFVRRLTLSAAYLAGAGIVSTAAFAGPQGLPSAIPPSSNPGECYARVKVPAVYDTQRQGVLVQDAHTKLEVRQPRLQSRQEQVMVKEASTRFRVRQPSYRSVTERIMTRPAYDKLSVSPPQFSTVQERVQTSAPQLVWKKGNPGQLRAQGYVIHSTAQSGGYASGYSGGDAAFHNAGLGGQECGAGCEIWCLVEEPGESKSVSRRVMTSPGDVRRTPVPAKYQTIHKQLLSDPGGVEQIHVPAEYRSVMVEDIVDPGGVREVPIQGEYASVDTKVLISPERYEWRRVLCAPGTGSMPRSSSSSSSAGYSSGTYNSGSYGSSGYSTGYTSGGYTSGGYSSDDYSSGSVRVRTESSQYGVFQGSPAGQDYGGSGYYDPKTGYYGTEKYPAYGASRKRSRRRY